MLAESFIKYGMKYLHNNCSKPVIGSLPDLTISYIDIMDKTINNVCYFCKEE